MRAETLTGFHAGKGVVKDVRSQSTEVEMVLHFSINFPISDLMVISLAFFELPHA